MDNVALIKTVVMMGGLVVFIVMVALVPLILGWLTWPKRARRKRKR